MQRLAPKRLKLALNKTLNIKSQAKTWLFLIIKITIKLNKMKKLLFGLGILAMLFATATISSCGEAESVKTEVKEGEDGEKCCSKDKECSKECKDICKKNCTADCTEEECSDECKAACKAACKAEGKACNQGAEHKCSDMKCEEGKCGHGEEEGTESEEAEEMKCEEGKCGHGDEEGTVEEEEEEEEGTEEVE